VAVLRKRRLGCDMLDWPGDISISFDGWCFLRFPIPQNQDPQWLATPWDGGTVAYPIKLTGLAVVMTRKALDLTEMAPVRPVVAAEGPLRLLMVADRHVGGLPAGRVKAATRQIPDDRQAG